MPKKVFFLVFITLGFLTTTVASAQEAATAPIVYVFGDAACTICRTEVKWLFDEGIAYKYLNIDTDTQARAWFDKLLLKHDISPITPLTVVGEAVIVGYEKEQTTGRTISRAIKEAKKSDIKTVEDHLARAPKMEVKETAPCEGLSCDTTNVQAMASIPFLGLVNLRDTSLMLVAVILGAMTQLSLLSVGYLIASAGFLLLSGRRLYLVCIGILLCFTEAIWHLYFLMQGFRDMSRFVIDGLFAKVLGETYAWLLWSWHAAVYSGVALIDNLLIILALFFLFPYVQKLDDERPGSVGMIATTLLFVGGVCITYFILFSTV